MTIQAGRIHGDTSLKSPVSGNHVLYWMQDAVRIEQNHALAYAIDQANLLNKPLLVLFVLTPSFPEGNLRHFSFLAEGLVDVRQRLEGQHIRFRVVIGDPGVVVPDAASDACLLVTDHGYLRIENQWRDQVGALTSCPMVCIETGVVVPVQVASPKMEWSAGTFRPKISRLLPEYLTPLRPRTIRSSSLGWDEGDIRADDPRSLLDRLPIDRSVHPVEENGGESAGQSRLDWFINERLERYDTARNDPTARATSRLSAYLHYGHISPLHISLAILDAKKPGSAPFLEQLIVRRELSCNFLYYNLGYDSYADAIPDWAKRSLASHAGDTREYYYTREEFDGARTHDPYWNAMQTELVLTGYLHGYLRMYWGKKIIEWSETPQQAFDTALFLNNRYQLDGRDPNGYTGIAWCFGRHDRPWKERPVLGMIRYMNDRGLKRKFRIEAYRERIEIMAAESGHPFF